MKFQTLSSWLLLSNICSSTIGDVLSCVEPIEPSLRGSKVSTWMYDLFMSLWAHGFWTSTASSSLPFGMHVRSFLYEFLLPIGPDYFMRLPSVICLLPFLPLKISFLHQIHKIRDPLWTPISNMFCSCCIYFCSGTSRLEGSSSLKCMLLLWSQIVGIIISNFVFAALSLHARRPYANYRVKLRCKESQNKATVNKTKPKIYSMYATVFWNSS
jgi:hypothetical protein